MNFIFRATLSDKLKLVIKQKTMREKKIQAEEDREQARDVESREQAALQRS